jgi:hypothetical protein
LSLTPTRLRLTFLIPVTLVTAFLTFIIVITLFLSSYPQLLVADSGNSRSVDATVAQLEPWLDSLSR